MAEASAERAERAAATTANPAPLGLSAFALTTFVLSAANAGWFAGAPIVIGLALFYGGAVQILAGMWEFRSGNTFGATAFSSYGGFWISFAFSIMPIFGGKSIAALAGSTGVGFYLLGWAIFTLLMFFGTLRANNALIVVFGLLFLAYLSLALGALLGASGLGTLGGYIGILTALAAWYTAFAGVLAAGPSAFKLPVGRRS